MTDELIEKSNQILASTWLLKLTNSLGFDLSNTFPGNFEDVTDLFERIAVAITEPITKLDDFPLSVAKRLQNSIDAIAEHFLTGTNRWAFAVPSGNKSPNWLSSLLPTGRSSDIG